MKRPGDRHIRYFVRDDDVGELTEALAFFVDLFISRKIPVSYQIIPGKFSQPCADFMLERRARNPDLIEFGQHGLHHRMEVAGEILNREFGPERSAEEQLAIVTEGARLLRARLGAETPVEVFTPPQHKYDRSTVMAAAAVGHRVFSASYRPSLRHRAAYWLGRSLKKSSYGAQGVSYHPQARPEARMVERSISVEVDNFATIKQSAASLAPAVAKASKHTDVVGFMFHHDGYGDQARRRTLVEIAERLAAYGPENFQLIGAGTG